ncbi:unnamed protein product [Linum tenue]|uniref:Uncharacterized protein n=1 Tax=Linum tenue TaxID=586396 RepID=A0AAV0JRJ2_9ROSI|nr:unnamed protein product [Linum tenue]
MRVLGRRNRQSKRIVGEILLGLQSVYEAMGRPSSGPREAIWWDGYVRRLASLRTRQLYHS